MFECRQRSPFSVRTDLNPAFAANGLNQYTSAGPATFTCDANGNLTGDGANTYQYDVENRLVSRSGVANATLTYDPLGRLFEAAGSSAGTTRFLYDPGSSSGAGGDELVAEYDTAGTLLRRYVHGPGTDDPLAWYEGAGLSDRRYYHSDERGSITSLAGPDSRLRQINSYDAYGIPAPTNEGRFGYTGQLWLPELGMWYYKARIYSPTLGRFMQTDPIGYEDQVNLYAYVGNDPGNAWDPSGMCTGSLIANDDGTCKGAGNVNPGLNGAGTSDGAVPGNRGENGNAGASQPESGDQQGQMQGSGGLQRTSSPKTTGPVLGGPTAFPGRVILSNSKIQHILARHGYSDAPDDAGRFSPELSNPEAISKIAQAALTIGEPTGKPFEFVADFKRVIGESSAWGGLFRMDTTKVLISIAPLPRPYGPQQYNYSVIKLFRGE